jgi:hypothetical protein
MVRLIDPLIADQQHEYADAIHRGDPWRRRWARVSGCVAFWKVIAMVMGRTLTEDVVTEDRGAIGRAIRVAGLATTLFTEGHLSRGTNELTFVGLRQLTRDPFVMPLIASRRAFDFHSRVALAFAPLALGLFALRVSTVRRRAAGVLIVGALGLATCFGYYVLIDSSRALMYRAPFAVSEHVPPIIAAWIPNLACLVSALLLHLRTRARSGADPSRLDDGRRSEDLQAVPRA